MLQKTRENVEVDQKIAYVIYEWPLSNHQSFSNLDPSLPSRQSLASHSRTENAHPAVRSHSQSLTKDITGSGSHFEMTLLPDPASVSVRKIDSGEFTENCQSNSISVSGSGSLIANGNGNTVASSLARLCHSSHSNVRHHSVNSRKIASLTQYPFPVCSWCATVFCKTQQFHGKSWRRSRHSEKRFNNKSQIHSFLTTISYINSFLYAFQSYVMYCFFSIKKLKSAI